MLPLVIVCALVLGVLVAGLLDERGYVEGVRRMGTPPPPSLVADGRRRVRSERPAA